MIINLDGSPSALPPRFDAEEAIAALEHDERTIELFQDDPHSWITLIQAVHNVLYPPSPLQASILGPEFYADQLLKAYLWIIEEIQETCELGGDDDETDESEARTDSAVAESDD